MKLMSANSDELKQQVQDYWNKETCGTWVTDSTKFTKEYFEDIEKDRYEKQPEILEFAEFDKFAGQKLLEVGVGAGTDFVQWVRGGAKAYGIDLTEEAIRHLDYRLELYGLKAEGFKVADCENLPFEDNTFDIVYSWGVIHHTPNTLKALDEIIRVLKPNGLAKIMIYNRKSVLAYLFWVKHALLKGKFTKSVAWVLWNYMESVGTKAYTIDEVKDILNQRPVKEANVKAYISYYDKLERFSPILQFVAKITKILMGGEKAGWELTFQFKKK